MSTIIQNTTDLQTILDKVNELPKATSVTAPLIVTGNFPASYEEDSNGLAFSNIDNGMNLSHSVEEMIEAFQAGREVRIKLSRPANVAEIDFGGYNLQFAELLVTRAEVLVAGMYDFYAYGMGYTSPYISGGYFTTPLQIYCSLNPMPRLYTPTKDAQKNELVQAVISALPVYDGEVESV